MLEWLREVKGQAITPERVEALAGRDSGEGSRGERDRQLATFYRRYQLFLAENDYADAEGMLWLAAEALEANPPRIRQTARLQQMASPDGAFVRSGLRSIQSPSTALARPIGPANAPAVRTAP